MTRLPERAVSACTVTTNVVFDAAEAQSEWQSPVPKPQPAADDALQMNTEPEACDADTEPAAEALQGACRSCS